MSCPPRSRMAGAFTVVSTRTFVLMLAIVPLAVYAPRVVTALVGVAVVLSLIADWKRTKAFIGSD